MTLTHAVVATAVVFTTSPLSAQRDGRGDCRFYYYDTLQSIQLTFENFIDRGGKSSTSFPSASQSEQLIGGEPRERRATNLPLDALARDARPRR